MTNQKLPYKTPTLKVRYPGEDEKELLTPRPMISNAEAFAEAAAASGSGGGGEASGVTNLVSTPDQYGSTVTLTGSDSATKIPLVALCRGYWKEPTAVTIRSQIAYSPIHKVNFFDATGVHQFVWARAYVRVTWGYGNQVYSRDVAVGQDFEVTATFVEVKGWMAWQGVNRAGDPATWFVPSTVTCKVSATILESNGIPRKPPTQYQSYGPNSDPTGDLISQHNGVMNCGGANTPLVLYEISGFHEAATDLYLLLFDTTGYAGAFFGPDQSLANGDAAVWSEKVPAGSSFSLTFERGLSFQKGLAALWSTTSQLLTATNANELGPSAGGILKTDIGATNWAMNITYDSPVLGLGS